MVDIHLEIGRECRPRDAEIAELATRQHGQAARWQLLEMGFRNGAIDRRVRAGRLQVQFRGVYSVGHRKVSWLGRTMAAVLACGRDALASHRSSGALHAIRPSARAIVDVTAPRTRRGHPGIELHQSRLIHPDDRDEIDGIPVTSLPRTLLDLAEVLGARQLERAWDEAERLRVLDVRAVEELCDRSRGHRGLKLLLPLLGQRRDADRTRSELERDFLDFCRNAGLPRPEVNVAVAGYEVDALWRDARLVVELDSRTYHANPRAFEEDRKRDAALLVAGFSVLRITDRRLKREPADVARTIRALLRRPGSGAPA